MIDFLIKSSCCLIAFLSFYHLVLQREKMHHFNRFYLLASIIVSLILPFVTFEIIKIIPVTEKITSMPEMPFSFEAVPEKINYTPYILWTLYGLVTSLLLIRFGKNIWKLISISKSNPTVNYKNAKLVLIDEKSLPHTFLDKIYINFEDYNERNIEAELYTHELVHVTQKHTLDILFIEFLKTIFWFNPIFILYKKAIQLNHEFLADEEVVESYNNVPFYQSLLLQKGNGNQTIYLASNLNYLVTKKRLIMMTKNTSKTIALIKKVAVVPILVGLIYFFCIEVVAQEKVTTNYSNGKNAETDDKIRDAYYKGVWVKLFDQRINKRISSAYEDLSLEEKRKYLDYVPKPYQQKSPSEKEFANFKDSKKYAVWIDGKHVSNKELNKYKPSEFAYFAGSPVYKNARSKKFPQPFQYTFYTKDYFDKNMKNSHLKFSGDTVKLGFADYNKALKQKRNKIKADTLVWVEEVKSDNPDEKIGDKYVNEKGSFDAKGNFLKEGYIKINNKTYMYVTNKDNEIEYFTRWGDRVNKKGEPLTSETNKDSDTPKSAAELTEKPEYEGGMVAFYKYIAENYKVPEEVNKNKLKGKVYISFVIEKDGSLSNVKALKDMGYGTGEEAERVLKSSPKWKPGKIDGKPVRTSYSLPIAVIWD